MFCSLPARLAGATGLLLLAHSGISAASCVHIGSTPSQAFITIDSRLTVSAADPVGTVIYDSNTRFATRMAYRCSAAHEQRAGFTQGFTHIGEGIHQTNLEGIGIKITGSEAGASRFYRWPVPTTRHPAGTTDVTPWYRLQLIKTGPVTSGVLFFPQTIISHTFEPHHIPANTARLTMVQTRVEVVSADPTCAVDPGSKTIPVNLRDHPAGFFDAVGKVTAPQPLEIRLNCAGGSSGSRLNVSYTVSDASNPGNQTSIISLASHATARGIGIRLLRSDNTPIVLGTRQPGGTVGAGPITHRIPLLAQYVQTASRVTPGSAPGRATFLMSYD
ncbi:fimbrial protein [Pseudomonas sp. 2(2015)]|uniref:fimbrial protein n=1 Tax=Pseudomonas sp. 2(2015) TaxID=1619950 RepID=UPI0009E2ECDA|nr:fimbrial protein [Pseudomonas sp. 2(2015)]